MGARFWYIEARFRSRSYRFRFILYRFRSFLYCFRSRLSQFWNHLHLFSSQEVMRSLVSWSSFRVGNRTIFWMEMEKTDISATFACVHARTYIMCRLLLGSRSSTRSGSRHLHSLSEGLAVSCLAVPRLPCTLHTLIVKKKTMREENHKIPCPRRHQAFGDTGIKMIFRILRNLASMAAVIAAADVAAVDRCDNKHDAGNDEHCPRACCKAQKTSPDQCSKKIGLV